MTEKLSASAVEAAAVSVIARARDSFLWVVTREEARVEQYLMEAARLARYKVKTWDCGQGVANADGRVERGGNDASEVINMIRAQADANPDTVTRTVWIMRDMHAWLRDPITQRQLRNLIRHLPTTPRSTSQCVIVLTSASDIPPELAADSTLVEWPLPDRSEISDILDAVIESQPEDTQEAVTAALAKDGLRDSAIDAAVGLSGREARSCFARSLVKSRQIEPSAVAGEKKRIITGDGVEWYPALPGGFKAVGGLENLKAWVRTCANAYTADARAYGLPAPRGAMLVGPPGTGKTHTAKAIATEWGVPLLKMDLGAMKSKFVGDSEANIRRAFKVVTAIGRSVLWFDEIEKQFGGATNGAADGGVSTDALGAVLTWMQESKSEAFVLMTANDVEALPPELMRKGRLDRIWFVDLPTQEERVAVLKAAVASHGRQALKLDYDRVAEACPTFTGAELAAVVVDALFIAYADKKREITTRDLLKASESVVPVATTAAEKVERLRKWADERATPAGAAGIKPAKPINSGRSNRIAVDL